MSFNQSNLNIPNEHILLINILNNIYNDNLRQIQTLTASNTEIRNDITNILSGRVNRYQPNNNRYRFRNYYNSTSNNNNSNINENLNTNTIPNSNTNTIPNSNTNTIPNSNTNTIPNSNTNTIPNLNTNTIPNSNTNTIPNSNTNNNINNNENIFDYSINHFDNISEYYTPYSSSLNRLPSLNYESSNTNQTNVASRVLQRFLEPVLIYPTEAQLNIAIRQVIYSDIISPINRSCPISLDNFNDNELVSVIRFCGHIFKTEQLNTWFRSNCRCPVCRYDIRNYTRNSENNNIPSFPDASLNNVEITNEERNLQPNNTNLLSSASDLANNMFNLITSELDTIANDILFDSSGNIFNNTLSSRVILNDITGNFFYDNSGNLLDDNSRQNLFLLRFINVLDNNNNNII